MNTFSLTNGLFCFFKSYGFYFFAPRNIEVYHSIIITYKYLADKMIYNSFLIRIVVYITLYQIDNEGSQIRFSYFVATFQFKLCLLHF